MTTLENIDIVVERERDAAADAQPFQLVEPFVYNKESWHSDCGDLLGGDIEASNAIRKELMHLFASMPVDGGYPCTDRSKIINTQCMAMYMMNIGGQIFENAIKNGLTLKKLGERTE